MMLCTEVVVAHKWRFSFHPSPESRSPVEILLEAALSLALSVAAQQPGTQALIIHPFLVSVQDVTFLSSLFSDCFPPQMSYASMLGEMFRH